MAGVIVFVARTIEGEGDENPVKMPTALRIGYLTDMPVDDPSVCSGMAFGSYTAIKRLVPDLILLDARPVVGARAADRRTLFRRVVRRIDDRLSRTKWGSERDYRLLIAGAEQVTRRAHEVVGHESAGLDAIVCAFAGRCLYGEAFNVPVVYASDATARLLNESQYFRGRSAGFHRAGEEVESRIARVASRAAFASEATRRSAIDTFGYATDRSHVVPMGANIKPEPGSAPRETVPTAEETRLLLVAADPVRKRLALCVDVAEWLRANGIRATLDVVGGQPPESILSPAVRYHGRLSMAREDDRRRMRELYASCHVLLLPSVAEMFGIAPAEAGQFGRPSVVSDAGGLPTVVRDGETGFVVPVEAPASAYAMKIREMVADEGLYRRLATGALARARSVLNWDSWAESIVSLCEECAARDAKFRPLATTRGCSAAQG